MERVLAELARIKTRTDTMEKSNVSPFLKRSLHLLGILEEQGFDMWNKLCFRRAHYDVQWTAVMRSGELQCRFMNYLIWGRLELEVYTDVMKHRLVSIKVQRRRKLRYKYRLMQRLLHKQRSKLTLTRTNNSHHLQHHTWDLATHLDFVISAYLTLESRS
uniref:Uncharacterized protein n=1 Tax=Hyaloperonospora arabidopsidis (strain Emoy2) TaxID=559515 RepID=M4B5F2_HYAAE